MCQTAIFALRFFLLLIDPSSSANFTKLVDPSRASNEHNIDCRAERNDLRLDCISIVSTLQQKGSLCVACSLMFFLLRTDKHAHVFGGGFLWAILTKLTDYVFLTHCYILRKFGQDRTIYHIAAIGTIRCKLKLCMKIFVIFWDMSTKLTDYRFRTHCNIL